MVCVMTHFVFLKPLRTKSAKEVAFALVNVFANFGVPQILQSDNKQVMVADSREKNSLYLNSPRTQRKELNCFQEKFIKKKETKTYSKNQPQLEPPTPPILK